MTASTPSVGSGPVDSTGFTGVDWSSVDPARIAADVWNGPGPVPAAALSSAWARVADDLEAIAAAHRSTFSELSEHWSSEAAPRLRDRSVLVGDRIRELAGRARELSARAADHADAHTAARIALPGAAEVDATRRGLEALEALGPALGGLLVGATDAAESALVDHRRSAAAAMREYERRTTPVAEPLPAPPAPERLVVEPVGLRAASEPDVTPEVVDSLPEPSGTATVRPQIPAVPPSAAAPSPVEVPLAPRPAARPSVRTPLASEVVTPPSRRDSTAVSPSTTPLAAPPVAAAPGDRDDEHRPGVEIRPGSHSVGVDDLYGLSVAVAPAVLGSAAPVSAPGEGGGDP